MDKSATQVEDLLTQIEGWSDAEILRLVQRLIALLEARNKSSAPASLDDEPPWTDDEIKAMLTPQPMTGKQIVEAGLAGGWADLGIEDGAQWVEEQRAQRRAKPQMLAGLVGEAR